MRDSLQHSLAERKQIHADALELAEAESRDLFSSVVAAQARASAAEEELAMSRAKLEEYRENDTQRFSSELAELKQDWSNQMTASVMQSELRSALEKTRTVAEEQALRITVLTDERSRMIQEQTTQRRTWEETEQAWKSKLALMTQQREDDRLKSMEQQQQYMQTLAEEKNNTTTLVIEKNALMKELEISKREHHEMREKEQCQQESLETSRAAANASVLRVREMEQECVQLKSELVILKKELHQAVTKGTSFEKKLNIIERERKEEKSSVESMLGNMQQQRSTASERMVAEAAARAVQETEERLNEQHSGKVMLLNSEIFEKNKTMESLKKNQIDTTRKMELLKEKIMTLNGAMEGLKRKVTQAEDMVDGKDETIGRLETKIGENEKNYKKEMESLKRSSALQLSSEVAEAYASSRREEEKKTTQTLKEMQKRLDTNNEEMKEARALLFVVVCCCVFLFLVNYHLSTAILNPLLSPHTDTFQFILFGSAGSAADVAAREGMEATLQRDRLVQQLTDARSEIEENQRAVLETLKLSSEIQARESEYKHQMENEREGHGRTRNELESCKF